MIVQFSINQDDYQCLIEHVSEEDVNARSALLRAKKHRQLPDGDHGWRVACSPTDAVVMLRIALTHCPDAVPDIRAGLNSTHSGS
jgi:hypothetical protein